MRATRLRERRGGFGCMRPYDRCYYVKFGRMVWCHCNHQICRYLFPAKWLAKMARAARWRNNYRTGSEIFTHQIFFECHRIYGASKIDCMEVGYEIFSHVRQDK